MDIPKEFYRYLWDNDIEKMTLSGAKNHIISRVLEHGNLEDVYLLLHIYAKEDIIQAVRTSREISKRTAYFWKNYYDIKDSIICLEKALIPGFKTLWPY